MKITLIVAGIFLIVIAIVFGITSFNAIHLPTQISKPYSLEWLPPEAPRDIERFQIDLNNRVIKYRLSDEQASEPTYIIHPLKIKYLSSYNLDDLLIINGYLTVIMNRSSGWVILTVAMSSFFAAMLGVAGSVILIKGIRGKS